MKNFIVKLENFISILHEKKEKIKKNKSFQKYLGQPYNKISTLIYKPLRLIFFRKYFKIKRLTIKLLHKVYTTVDNFKIQQSLRLHIYTFPIYIISFFFFFQDNFVITCFIWLYYWIYFWSTMLFVKAKNYNHPQAVYNSFALCDYIAVWIFLSCAPMIFHMFVYSPFWFAYMQP